ncbi:hypothetical protein [Breznakia pachnodae]|uniref:Uncharacterized protein n=1 Tax=Breznakia pachnodae TaxID=265178 RepID=A0ABU0E4H0_9FIRM|nr:hypothetical protein [Breznakia pachnodae]MDQ0361624.1 hypothetical protein [Breznakia pachnodae]
MLKKWKKYKLKKSEEKNQGLKKLLIGKTVKGKKEFIVMNKFYEHENWITNRLNNSMIS